MLRTLKKNDRANGDARDLGRFGESFATDYLRVRGYSIVATNFKAMIGRNRKGVAVSGEIDIIAVRSGLLCFVEVKTRKSMHASPETAVTLRKQRQIARTARAYKQAFDIRGVPERFDVITLITRDKKAPILRHLKGFWSPDIFKKGRWKGDSRFFA